VGVEGHGERRKKEKNQGNSLNWEQEEQSLTVKGKRLGTEKRSKK